MAEEIGKVRLDYGKYPGEDFYCDGAVEDEILDIVKNRRPEEHAKVIEESRSWPILYHLSPLRENIVDWVPMDGAKVLEVGSGCGAITGALARRARSVTCVELSRKRSLINAWRHKECGNITIHVGNFKDIEPELPRDYDLICLIGVFEYGQSYIGGNVPYEDFLKILMPHLAEGGRILIAIENQYGLKYFAGCAEDHLGTFFSGIENYEERTGVRTFSRNGLEKIFAKCGAGECHFYYPYPDYKFMTTLYSDRCLPRKGELSNNIRNFDRDRMMLFHERSAFDGLVEDGLFSVFANSFLAVIGKGMDTVYSRYSNDRKEEYRIRTDIVDTPAGRKIRKLPLTGEAAAHIQGMETAYGLLRKRYEGSGLAINPCRLAEDGKSAEFPFERGVALTELLDDCLGRGDLEGFYRLFDRYYELISHGEGQEIADYDLVFSNILVDGDSWTAIDYEWTVRSPVPSREIAFRAVHCYLLEEGKRNRIDIGRILDKLGITPEEAEEYRLRERAFQRKVTGSRRSLGELIQPIGTHCIDVREQIEKYRQTLHERKIQVYFDRGEGFREEDSHYMRDVYTGPDSVEAKIPFGRDVVALRIDPTNHYCAVKIRELLQNGVPVPLTGKYLTSNGRAATKETYVFATEDPNLTVRVSALPRQEENILSVKLRLSFLQGEMAEELARGGRHFLMRRGI